MDVQLKRGLLDICVLAAIKEKQLNILWHMNFAI